MWSKGGTGMNKQLYKEIAQLIFKAGVYIFAIIGLEDFLRYLYGV